MRTASAIGIAAAFLLAGALGEARQAVTTNLAAHWPMESFASGSTPDASGNGHPATQATTLNQPATTPGHFGNGLNFDTTDSLTVADAPGLNVGTGNFTVAAWVKPSGTASNRVMNKWNGTMGWLLDVNATTGGTASAGILRLKMNDGTNNIDYSTNASLSSSAFVHVAATVDRTAKQLKLYANGVQIGTTYDITALTGSLTNAALLGIGNIPSNGGNYYGGALDDVRLYTAALTQPQIATLIQLPAPAALSAVAGNARIDLSWTAVTDATEYRVYRSVTSGTGYAQVQPAVTGTTFIDSGAQNGVTYYYVVRAFNVLESANSPEASGLPVAPPPRTEKLGNGDGMCGWSSAGTPGAGTIAALLAALAWIAAFRRRA